MNILVLCIANSIHYIMLELLFNRLSNSRVTAYFPNSKVHPQSPFLLEIFGCDTDILWSKNWDECATTDALPMKPAITVCGSVAGEQCPIRPGTSLRAHWRVKDPARSYLADWEVAFQTIFDQLKRRALAFLDQSFKTKNPRALTPALNNIGALS